MAKDRVPELEAALTEARKRISRLEHELAAAPPAHQFSEEHLDLALRAARMGVWDWDIVNESVKWSDSVESLFGMAPGTFDGTYESYLKILPDEDRATVLSAVEKTLASGSSYRVDHRIRTAQGEVRWLSAWGKLFRDESGTPLRILGIVADINDLRLSVEELEESEERFRAFADASFEGIAFSTNGKLVDTNRAFTEMLGYEPGQLNGTHVSELVFPADLERVRARMSQDYRDSYQHRAVKKDGSTIFVEVRGRPIKYLGKPARLTSLRDITEQKRLATERNELEQQLLQAQKMEAVGQLAGGIAHDFNNILTVVLGNLDLATSDLESDEETSVVLDSLKEVTRSAERAQVMTAQLLAFSRRQPSRPQCININDVLQDMTAMLRRLIRENVQLTVEAAADLHTTRVDPGQLQQVIMNLVVNARDAMLNGGQLKLITSNVECPDRENTPQLAGPCVRLRVSDTGCGMSGETLTRVFEPFYTTKEPGAGTGLGLSMAYGIIHQAGGRIDVTSQEGQGTTIDIRLPRHAGKKEPLPVSRQTGTPPGGNETVLVCEDDSNVRNLMVRILSNAGYRVLQASCGKQALTLAVQSSKIDLLVTDVIMPEMDGKELSTQLAKQHPTASTLFCSGYTADVISQRGVIEKGVEFLAKPFTRASLLQRVRQLLEA